MCVRACVRACVILLLPQWAQSVQAGSKQARFLLPLCRPPPVAVGGGLCSQGASWRPAQQHMARRGHGERRRTAAEGEAEWAEAVDEHPHCLLYWHGDGARGIVSNRWQAGDARGMLAAPARDARVAKPSDKDRFKRLSLVLDGSRMTRKETGRSSSEMMRVRT